MNTGERKRPPHHNFKMSKRKGSDDPSIPSKKQVLTPPSSTLCLQTENEDEYFLVKQINGCMAVIAEQYDCLTTVFPYKIVVERPASFNSRRVLNISKGHLRFQRPTTPFISLLGMTQKRYNWEDISKLLSHLSGEDRSKELSSIRQQLEEWEVRLGALQSAYRAIMVQLSRIGGPDWNGENVSVKPDNTSPNVGSCLCWHLTNRKLKSVPGEMGPEIQQDGYVQFAETMAKFLEMFSPAS